MAWLDQNHLEDVLQSTDILVLPLDCLIQQLLVGPEHQYVKKKKTDPQWFSCLGTVGPGKIFLSYLSHWRLLPLLTETPTSLGFHDGILFWFRPRSPLPHLLPLLSRFLSSVLHPNRGTPQCPKLPPPARLSPLVSVFTFIALNPTHLPMTSQVWIGSPNHPKVRKELPTFHFYLDVEQSFQSNMSMTEPSNPTCFFQPSSSP